MSFSESESAALAVVDAYIDTFNQRDSVRWLATMHYPHVRHADTKLTIDETPPTNSQEIFVTLQKTIGWARTRLDSKQIVQSDPEKVHVAVTVTRLRQNGSEIHTFNSLYVVTKQDGKWAIAIRSSFATDKFSKEPR